MRNYYNKAGTVVAEQNFDAWGRNRNPANWTYSSVPAKPDWLYRGFTGHEHLAQFALINMNGRMYDPVTCRMLSPDNYVPLPWNTQGYNKYGYANNNPLIYTDPDGNFWHIIVGALIGGIVNLTVKALQGEIHNLGDGFKAFGVGAVAGGVTAATGGAALSLTGLSATSIAGGAVAGFAGSVAGSPILGVGNNVFFGDPYSVKQFGKDVLFGTSLGAIGGGIGAAIKGKNIWFGDNVASGRNIFSLNNTPIEVGPQVVVGPTIYGGWAGDDGKLITEFAGNKIGQVADNGESVLNQSSKAILNHGYYEVNGFKFSKYYYNKLWTTGRGAPSLIAREILEGGGKTAIPDALKAGFNKYIYGGWEMIYNPNSKEVWHLQPIR